MKYVPNHHLDCPMFTSSSTKPSYQMTQTLPTYQRYEQLTPQMSNFSFGNNYNTHIYLQCEILYKIIIIT